MDNITIFGQVDGDLHRTVRFLQERNVNVVIRDERDLNTIRIREAKAKEKEKATISGKGKKNVHPVDWIEKFMELKRRNMTSLLRWGCNKIIVHVPHWGYIQVDTKTFWKVMRRKFGRTHI
ncbi:uncharacterized protein LOC127794551 [Diospyros lotus]|uniref:uncharacterized protein LOC127794551 n=1 Tax=Diospyros lotus TaxID=55363 RepID=UPI0022572A3F|nr:uncharacterized protein LOC127794551 [Diospyros lotus]